MLILFNIDMYINSYVNLWYGVPYDGLFLGLKDFSSISNICCQNLFHSSHLIFNQFRLRYLLLLVVIASDYLSVSGTRTKNLNLRGRVEYRKVVLKNKSTSVKYQSVQIQNQEGSCFVVNKNTCKYVTCPRCDLY